MRLRVKFALLTGALTTAAALSTAALAVRHELSALDVQLRARGASLARNLALNASDSVLAKDRLSLAAFAAETAGRNPGALYAFVLDAHDVVLAHSDPEPNMGRRFDPGPALRRAGGGVELAQSWRSPYGEVLDFSHPVADRGTALRLGEAHVGLSRSVLDAARAAVVRDVALAAAAILLASLAAAGAAVGFALRPLKALTEAAREVGGGNFAHRIEVSGRDEIGELSRTFNAMTEGLLRAESERLEKQRIQKDLAVGRDVQRMLIPEHPPAIRGARLASLYRAAQEVGGDVLDFLDAGGGRVGLAVADVSGKGVPAALLMATVRTALRACAKGSASPRETLAEVNSLVEKDLSGDWFVTMLYLVYDPKSRRARFATAGHQSPVHVRAATGVATFVPVAAVLPPLGLCPAGDAAWQSSESDVRLASGDLLVLFTDGVTEAMTADYRAFGTDKLLQAAAREAPAGAESFVQALDRELVAHAEGAPAYDDVAVVALSVD